MHRPTVLVSSTVGASVASGGADEPALTVSCVLAHLRNVLVLLVGLRALERSEFGRAAGC